MKTVAACVVVVVCACALLIGYCIVRYHPWKRRSYTALHQAVLFGDKATVEEVLSEGVDIHAINKHGSTALCLAAQGGRKDVAEVLITHGADVNDGSLAYAVASENMEMIEFLVSKGARTGGDALVQATAGGRLDIAEFLISKGADVNAWGVELPFDEPGVADSEQVGQPPLCVAAWLGRLDIVKLLLASGADPGVKNRYDKTALDLARKRGHQAVIEVLQAPSGK